MSTHENIYTTLQTEAMQFYSHFYISWVLYTWVCSAHLSQLPEHAAEAETIENRGVMAKTIRRNGFPVSMYSRYLNIRNYVPLQKLTEGTTPSYPLSEYR
ncbi:unnamed protein product [Leptosia nina]|uniref:Uncharacterized protein n=1 Tax=Leptosia nina TaxID=320188 RepID=A0AAV1J234_9NEOP